MLNIKQIIKIAIASFFGIVLYFVFENTGLKFTGASNASMIVAAVPIFTLILEARFFKMKITARIITSIILSIIGVYLVISVNGTLEFSSSTFKGNILIMGAMLSWVIYTVLNKSFSDKHSSLTLTSYQTFVSIFLFIPFIIPEEHAWRAMTLIPFLTLLYLGICCSACAYFFYIYASKRLGPTVSSTYLNLIPVVTVISGYFVLDEKLALIQIGGMVLIMLSLFRISKK